MKHIIYIVILSFAVFDAADAQTPRFSYHIKNRTIVTNGDHQLTRMVIIMPLAQTNQYQTVSNVNLNGGEVVSVPKTDDTYVRWTYTDNLPVTNQSREIFYDFDVTLNMVQFDFSRITELYPYDTTSKNYRWYTGKSGHFVDPDYPTIRETGDRLWAKSSDILDYARKCYEYVASNYKYLNPLTGLHPLPELLTKGGGDCGNLSSIFVSLLRYKKIPARHVVTVRPDGSYHVWADFFLEKYGWIPVDVTYKNSDPFGEYFGKYDGNGIVMTTDVCLPIDKGNGEIYVSDILQNYNWWIWYNKGSRFELTHKLTSIPHGGKADRQMVSEIPKGQDLSPN